jgi:hypothetical protein
VTTRARIIEIAEAEIGPQRKGSQRVYEYWRSVLPPEWSDAQAKTYAKTRDWCGGFALWCLKQAGIAQDIYWQDGIGFLGPAGLKQTRTPSRGDIGYLPQPFQHHLLYSYEHDGKVHSVDGNQPGVRQQVRPRQGIVFYSIEPLLLAQAPPEAGFVRNQPYSVPGIQDEE